MSGKILIVDDVSTNRIVMKVKLAAAGYQPVMASDGASCLAAVKRERPDLVLLDLMLPDISGIDVLRRLRDIPGMQTVPVVMFSATQDENARIAAFHAGADDFLAKPIDDQIMLARIRNFMRARSMLRGLEAHQHDMAVLGLAEQQQGFRRPGVIAVLATRADLGLKRQRELARYSNDRVLVLTPNEALSEGMNPASVPDVFMIDANLDGEGSGLRLMSELRSRSHSQHASICLATAEGAVFNPAVAFDLGANDLVSATVGSEELAKRLQRLIARKREEDRLRASVQDGLRMAMIDPLTGLHNRRYGLAQMSTIAAQAAADGSEFAVMVADLDRFKQVNDRHGHAAGDTVLVEVASRLAMNLRAGDLVARIGGEEFLIVLPRTNLAEAQLIGQRLCRAVEETAIVVNGGPLSITVSIGLAASTSVPPRATVTELVDRADQALLRSKSAGRNQLTISKSAA